MQKPCIVTAWSAHMDYANESNCYLIDYEMIETYAALLWHPGYRNAMYANPSIEHCRALMRQIFEDYDEAKEKGVQARKDILNNWTWRHSVDKILKRLEEISQ
jgi:hypothetical protein